MADPVPRSRWTEKEDLGPHGSVVKSGGVAKDMKCKVGMDLLRIKKQRKRLRSGVNSSSSRSSKRSFSRFKNLSKV